MTPNASARPRPLCFALLLLVATTIGLSACGDKGEADAGGRGATPPVPVAVQTIKPGVVDVYANYPGRIRGAREVQVRSRVEGVLLKRHYNEGEYVKKGQLLFSIDPEPFEATVEQRDAQLAQAKAQLTQTQQTWQRISKLYKANATSEAERDKARAGLLTGRAAVKLAQANLKAAQIQLDYTSIEAPLSGVTSLQEIDEGALVTHGTQLTTVTQLDPVHVLFSVPAKDARMREKALNAMVQGDGDGDGETRQAKLILPTGKAYSETGVVDFTQSTIDPDTGTVRLRAIFDNGKRRLVPGRFVRVRIRLETRQHAVVVPDKALADSGQTTMVYVVTDDDKAKPVPVQLGPAVENGRIIEQGLASGDRVITIGLGLVHPGSDVKVVPASQLTLNKQDGAAAGSGAAQPGAADQGAEQAGDDAAPTSDQADANGPDAAGKQAN